jgi:hypothetical protein
LRLLLRGCGVCVCVCGCGTVWARKVPVVSAGSCHGHTKGGGGGGVVRTSCDVG